LLCRLEDGLVFTTDLTMVIFHWDPLMRRVNEIIDRVVEVGLYNYWIFLNLNIRKLYFQKKGIVHTLDGLATLTCITCNMPSISFWWAGVLVFAAFMTRCCTIAY
jgi:hypothetical protein